MSYGPATSSGALTATAQITTRPALVHAITVSPPSTGVATVILYDSEDSVTSGKTVLMTITQLAGINSVPYPNPVPVVANRGIYCVLTGTAAGYLVHYSPN